MILKNLLICAMLLSLVSCSANSDSKQIRDLKDIFHAYAVADVITDEKELIELELDNHDQKSLSHLLKGFTAKCDSMKQMHFNNDTLQNEVGKLLTGTIGNYKILSQKGAESEEFKKDATSYSEVTKSFWDYIIKNYALERFVTITEEIYREKNNKANFIKSPKYKQYQELMQTDVKAALKLLDKISAETTDFQERSVYQIEWADDYIMTADSSTGGTMGASQEASPRYKVILDKKLYSSYLFEAWVKWRTTDMILHGASHSSDVNNPYYNSVREKTAMVVLTYINQHPTDVIAINQFLQLATYDNVRRFGAFPYGNQNVVTFQQLFGLH